MSKKQASLIIVFSSLLIFQAIANENEPKKTGNFALPSSQQPGPLVSLGQNILDANVTQAYLLVDNLSGPNQHFIDIIPSLLFGITNQFSIFLNIPFAANYKQNNMHSSGLEDVFLQFEYAYHTNNTSRFSEQATILANITFPTGSIQKQPPTGICAMSFLLGTTYSRTYCDWYGFISPGAILTTSKNETKCGNKYFYQFGIGRNLYFKPSSWILSGLIEIDGQYTEKDKIQGEIDNNSGGNVIMITPSLWFSTNKLIVQLGIGFPFIQQLFGEQNKNHYLLVASLGYTF